MSSPIKLVIFDCDGTLVDSLAGIAKVMNLAMGAVGLNSNLSSHVVGQVVGLSLAIAIETLIPHTDQATKDAVLIEYKRQYAILADSGSVSPPLFPGVRETLDGLQRQSIVLAMATGKSRAGVQRNIRELNLEGYFQVIRTADCAPSKPNPEMVMQILTETGIDKSEAMIIGDTDYDIEMGHNAGILTCAVTFGCHSKERLAASNPHHWLDKLEDVFSLTEVFD